MFPAPCERLIVSAIGDGVMATAAMETFLRATDRFFHHKVNSAWMQGTALGLQPNAPTTLIPGYLVYFAGGIAFAYLYQRYAPAKNPATGVAYSLVVPFGLVSGVIMMPVMGFIHPLVKQHVIPKPGLFGLGLGAKASAFSMLSHIVYGLVLGKLSKSNIRPCEQEPQHATWLTDEEVKAQVQEQVIAPTKRR